MSNDNVYIYTNNLVWDITYYELISYDIDNNVICTNTKL